MALLCDHQTFLDMKTRSVKIRKESKSRFWFCLMCLLAFNFVFLPEVRADQDIDWEGEWHGKGKGRSVSLDIPIASYDENYLYIETAPSSSDITIRIVKNGSILYEETIYSPQTATTIALDFLEPGTYRLELTNQWGDYLFGSFEKYID